MHGYGPSCFLKTFGFRPKKSHLKIQSYKGYVKTVDIPPLFRFEEVEDTGTITVINRSGLTDRAALALASDYYNHRDDPELKETLKSLEVKIIKRGHKFTIFDIDNEGSEKS